MEQPGGNIGIVIGIPMCGRPVVPEWALALALQNWPLNTNITYCPIPGEQVADARNKICEFAIKKNARYIWFIDDDTAPPVHAIRHLIYAADQFGPPFGKTMVVAGIYTSKTEPVEPLVYRGNGFGAFWEWKYGQAFDVTGVGTGCMLVRVDCLKEIERPWFRTIDEAFPKGASREMMTDDLYFCGKVIAAGFNIMAHGGVCCDHWDNGVVKVDQSKRRAYSMLDVPDSYPMRDVKFPAKLGAEAVRGEGESDAA